MTQRYWFVRRSGDSAARPMPHTVQPVSWQGWATIAACAGLIGLGTLMWIDAARQGLPGGWMGLVFLTAIGGGLLFAAVGAKTDPERSLADYRESQAHNTGSKG